jgi:cytoskeletal protein RodZ
MPTPSDKDPDEAALESQPTESDPNAKPSRTTFVTVFVGLLIGVMTLWIAFLVWLVIRVFF